MENWGADRTGDAQNQEGQDPFPKAPMASRKKSAGLKPELLVKNDSIRGHMGSQKRATFLPAHQWKW